MQTPVFESKTPEVTGECITVCYDTSDAQWSIIALNAMHFVVCVFDQLVQNCAEKQETLDQPIIYPK